MRLPPGLDGEQLRLMDVEFGAVVFSVSPRTGDTTVDDLRRHDNAIRRLAAMCSAILPARFGTVAESAEHLKAEMVERRSSLGAALDLVAGCEQMTVRLPFRLHRPAASGALRVRDAPRPGTQYLRRLASETIGTPSWILRSNSSLRALVRAERTEVDDDSATFYHLIEAGSATRYQELLKRAGISPGYARAAGPFPPYAFVPGIDRAFWTDQDDVGTRAVATGSRHTKPRGRGPRKAGG